jgi:hypothetical protein
MKDLVSDGFYSYGIGQEQSSTIADFNRLVDQNWNAMIPAQAVESMQWALENGFLDRWS